MRKIIFTSLLLSAAAVNIFAQDKPLDIDLRNGIRLVLEDSRLVKIAESENEAAFAQSLQARAAFLPQASAYVKETYLKYEPASKFGTQKVATSQRQYLSAGVDVYQTIFDFGKSIYAYKAVGRAVDAAKINLDIVKRVAVLEFIMAYFDSLQAHKMVDVAQKNVESLSSYYKDVAALVKEGAAVKSDLLGVSVRLADAKQKLITARDMTMAADLRINLLLAMPMNVVVRLTDVESLSGQAPDEAEAQEKATERRLEMNFINAQLAALKYKSKSEKASNYPVVFVQGGTSYTENKYQVHPSNNYAAVGAKVNLFDGGYAGALAKEDLALAQKLRTSRAKLADDIRYEVKIAMLDLSDAGEKLGVAREALDSSRENTRMVKARYTEGAATSTEVLEAIALEWGAQTNDCNADYDLKRAYARLIYSTGGDIAKIYGGKNEVK